MGEKNLLHGLPFQFILSICIGNIKELLDSYTDIEHRKGASENDLEAVSLFSDDLLPAQIFVLSVISRFLNHRAAGAISPASIPVSTPVKCLMTSAAAPCSHTPAQAAWHGGEALAGRGAVG